MDWLGNSISQAGYALHMARGERRRSKPPKMRAYVRKRRIALARGQRMRGKAYMQMRHRSRANPYETRVSIAHL